LLNELNVKEDRSKRKTPRLFRIKNREPTNGIPHFTRVVLLALICPNMRSENS
jgi:hypothetical protein